MHINAIDIQLIDVGRFIWNVLCTLGLATFCVFIGATVGMGTIQNARAEEFGQRIIGCIIVIIAIMAYLAGTHWIHM